MWCEKYSGNSGTEERATAELKKKFKKQKLCSTMVIMFGKYTLFGGSFG